MQSLLGDGAVLVVEYPVELGSLPPTIGSPVVLLRMRSIVSHTLAMLIGVGPLAFCFLCFLTSDQHPHDISELTKVRRIFLKADHGSWECETASTAVPCLAYIVSIRSVSLKFTIASCSYLSPFYLFCCFPSSPISPPLEEHSLWPPS